MHLTDSIRDLYLNDQLTDLAIQSLFRESNAKRYSVHKGRQLGDMENSTGTLKLQAKNSILRGIGDVLAFNDAKGSKHVPGANGASTQTVIPKKTSKFNFESIYAAKPVSEKDKEKAANGSQLIQKGNSKVVGTPRENLEIQEATEQ